jgi:hypothetical protein
MFSAMSGSYDRVTTTLNAGSRGRQQRTGFLFDTPVGSTDSGPSVSYQTQRTAQLEVADITGLPEGRALYFGSRGWQLIHMQKFDPDHPVGVGRPAAKLRSTAAQSGYIPGAHSWLAGRATPRRLAIAAAILVGILVGVFLIPALSGHRSKPADTAVAAPAAAAPANTPAAQPYWEHDTVHGYTHEMSSVCDSGYWVAQDSGDPALFDMDYRCMPREWVTAFDWHAESLTFWPDSLQTGIYAVYDPGRVTDAASGTHTGSLQVIEIASTCPPQDDRSHQMDKRCALYAE